MSLVLTRRTGEVIYVDTPAGRLILTVEEIVDGRVVLAFDAPRDLRILRSEVKDDMRQVAAGKQDGGRSQQSNASAV